ncbi:MAG TPA: hypothetical protein VF384_11235 [Planctomycetota bacterium]
MAQHIVIVEDSPGIRKSVMRSIRHDDGADTIEAARDGIEDTQAIWSDSHDLILCDVAGASMRRGATTSVKEPFTAEQPEEHVRRK